MSPQPTVHDRLTFLDLTKGVLVLLMVVYHCLNYTNQYHLAFRFLSFLPPSFILIAGILVSIVYLPRYKNGDKKLRARLVSRGAKLLLLFVLLNVIAQFVRSPVYGQSQSIGVMQFFQNWQMIFFLGDGHHASFEVLLPIAYLLILAPSFLWLSHRSVFGLAALTTITVTGCWLLGTTGHTYANLNFLSVGLVGVSIGRLLPNPEAIGRPLLAGAIAFAIYFPISVSKGYVYIIQLTGAAIAIVLISSICARMESDTWWHRRLARIGQYSLLSYIAQIGLLQMLSRLVGRPAPLSVEALLLFVTTLVVMILIVESTEWLRRQAKAVDTAYRVVFA